MQGLGQTQEDLDRAKEIVRTLYKNPNGEPFELTNFQAIIFDAIYRKLKDRFAILTYTQFGKSDTVAMAVLTRVTTFAERWVIIGGSEDKAKIIMNRLIDHIFDNEYTKSKLTLKKAESIERLRHERSRSRITFKIGKSVGEVFILSGDTSKKGEDAGDILVGYGSPNVVCDDAPLLSDTINAKMFRMLGGHRENFLVKIGNAINRNHFFKSFQSDRYSKVVVSSDIGVTENRQKKEFFEDAKIEMNDPILYNSFYNCIFPPQDSPLAGVWIPLFTEDEIGRAMEWEEVKHFGENKLGVDVADSGTDHDVLVLRSAGLAEVHYDNQISDQMRLAGTVSLTSRDKNIGRTYVDRTGVGAGLCSRLRELGFPHRGVNFGEKSFDPLFANKKAELYWRAKKWISSGGKLSKDQRWYQLASVLYSVVESSGRVQIMPKRIALNMGIKSPDVADAFVMTFYDSDRIKATEDQKEDNFFKEKMKKNQLKHPSDYFLRMSK